MTKWYMVPVTMSQMKAVTVPSKEGTSSFAPPEDVDVNIGYIN